MRDELISRFAGFANWFVATKFRDQDVDYLENNIQV